MVYATHFLVKLVMVRMVDPVALVTLITHVWGWFTHGTVHPQ